jgi:hypothetical protein
MQKSEQRQAHFSTLEMLLRVFLFLAHAISAIAMLAKAAGALDGVGCEAVVNPTSIQVRVTDTIVTETNPVMYALAVNRARNVTQCNSTWSTATAWCLATNLPETFDVLNDINSHTFGASWNTIATIMVFEWITASYALFYVDPFDSFMPVNALIWGMHPILIVSTLWNGALLVVIWAVRESLKIPPNNALIFSFCLVFSIVVQNFLSISKEPYPENDPEPVVAVAAQWRTDHFLRTRKKFDLGESWKPIDVNFHDAQYNQVIDEKGMGAIPRYLEYAVTAPLLLVALFSTSVAFAPTWIFQAMFVSLFACNMIGVSLHYVIVSLEEGRRIAIYLFAASWLSFGAGLYLFVWVCRDFLLKSPNVTGMPAWVLVLIWMLIVLYAMFGLLASYYYIPRMVSSGPFSSDDWVSLAAYFDYCSLFIKLPVAWTIWVQGAVILCDKAIVC